jgi:MFS family permease
MLGVMTPLRRLRRAAIDVEPLRHAAFRRLWLGNSLGFVGFQLTAVAVPVQVYELTGSSFWVGMLGLVGLVPLVMFGLWGGAVADAVDRRLLLLGSSLTLLYAALRLPALPPTGPATTPGLRSVVDGLAFIATRPVLLLSFAVDITAMVLAMPRALFPETAEQLGGRGTVGWLYAAIAGGAVLAGLSSGWVGRVHRQGVALVAAVVAWGLAVAAAGLVGSLWAIVLLLGVAGAADLVSAVYRQTILQTYAPDEMRGRMQGVFIVVVAGGPRLGDLRAGAAAAAFGVTAAWVGGGLLAAGLVSLALLVPALRNYDTRLSLQAAGHDTVIPQSGT